MYFRAEPAEDLRNMNQRLLKYVWFMTRTKPRKSDNPKSIRIDDSSKQNITIEKSPEEKFNEFLILRNTPFKSLFARKLNLSLSGLFSGVLL